MYSGDPVTNAGWTNSVTWKPGECYFQTNSGPAQLAPGQSQYIVVALLTAQGSDRLNSVAVLRQSARQLQDRYSEKIAASVAKSNGPERCLLFQNYPNPFNGETTITYFLPKAAPVDMELFNSLGQSMRHWVVTLQTQGWHQLIWNGRDESGRLCPAGVYFCRARLSDQLIMKKLIFLP
jgi:hypothetical protein